MKKLRSYLIFTYIILLILLMLSNCHGCDRQTAPIGDDNDTVVEEVVVIDDQEAVERAEQIGNDGDIKVTLLWDFPGDVDLHVVQPNGNELSYTNMTDSRTGGRLDVDNRVGGRGSAENIYWENPPHGRYVVKVVLYSVSPSAPFGGPVKIVVKVNGQTETFQQTLRSVHQEELVTSFNY